VPLYIICVRLGPSISGVYVRARVLVPLKPGCDNNSCEPKILQVFMIHYLVRNQSNAYQMLLSKYSR
jgi:hypothetical protein